MTTLTIPDHIRTLIERRNELEAARSRLDIELSDAQAQAGSSDENLTFQAVLAEKGAVEGELRAVMRRLSEAEATHELTLDRDRLEAEMDEAPNADTAAQLERVIAELERAQGGTLALGTPLTIDFGDGDIETMTFGEELSVESPLGAAIRAAIAEDPDSLTQRSVNFTAPTGASLDVTFSVEQN